MYLWETLSESKIKYLYIHIHKIIYVICNMFMSLLSLPSFIPPFFSSRLQCPLENVNSDFTRIRPKDITGEIPTCAWRFKASHTFNRAARRSRWSFKRSYVQCRRRIGILSSGRNKLLNHVLQRSLNNLLKRFDTYNSI